MVLSQGLHVTSDHRLTRLKDIYSKIQHLRLVPTSHS